MATSDIGATTTTDMKGTVSSITVAAQIPDAQGAQKETVWDYPDAKANLGYYKSIPELKASLHILGLRTCGLGWTADNRVTAILEGLTGWGEDSFQSIMQEMIKEKKYLGDSMAEIVRNKETGTLLNLKKLWVGAMRSITNEQGILIRYEQILPDGSIRKLRPEQVLHLCNDRAGNEIHGTSVIESLKLIIDAKNEALQDERTIRHRQLLGVLEVDTDDTTKIADAVKQYQNAVKNNEVLVTIKGTSELKDNPMTTKDRLQWLQYLDNLFYQVVGVPKVLVTSEGYTEAGGKAGLLAFEPVEIAEKTELESDLWNQAAIRVKFNRAPSLLGETQQTETKNAGQTGIQPNETEVRPTRTE